MSREARPKVRLVLNKIYLVARGEAARTEVRVTQRVPDSPVKPAVCRFMVVSTDAQDNPVGTLVLTEDLWKTWYGNYKPEEFMPGMASAMEAAETMVQRIPDVYYGCPLCEFSSKSFPEALRHGDAEAERLLKFFDVEVG